MWTDDRNKVALMERKKNEGQKNWEEARDDGWRQREGEKEKKIQEEIEDGREKAGERKA